MVAPLAFANGLVREPQPKTILKTPSWSSFRRLVDSTSSDDDDDDDNDDKPCLVRAKSVGYRPLSPKKTVRFADTHGLALAQVRVFNIKEPDDATSASSSPKTGPHRGNGRLCKSLSLACQQPSSRANFNASVMENNVCLENVAVRGLRVVGTVRVKNVAYEKRVTVRWSADNWATHRDVAARYVGGYGTAGGSATDRFAFEIDVPSSVEAGQKVQFAVRYVVPERGDVEYWDNNLGKNYSLECYTVWKNGKKTSDLWHDGAGSRGGVFGISL